MRQNVAIRDSDNTEIAEMVEREGELPDIAAAVAELHQAIAGMSPDDVLLEVTSERAGDRSSTKFKFRAYRRK